MSRWVHYDKEWFNLDDFCHIWIEEKKITETIKYGPLETDYTNQIVNRQYYAMGEWRHNGEEVVISQDWDSYEELRRFLNEKLIVSVGMDDLTLRAALFAKFKHDGQLDDCGNDYFDSHVKQVYAILLQITEDVEILAAAYLHDTIEDTDTTYEELLSHFGRRVADLVMEVTHDGQKDSKGYYFPRLKTKDGILIKFADRLSNLSRMENWNVSRQNHYLKRSKFWKSE